MNIPKIDNYINKKRKYEEPFFIIYICSTLKKHCSNFHHLSFPEFIFTLESLALSQSTFWCLADCWRELEGLQVLGIPIPALQELTWPRHCLRTWPHPSSGPTAWHRKCLPRSTGTLNKKACHLMEGAINNKLWKLRNKLVV